MSINEYIATLKKIKQDLKDNFLDANVDLTNVAFAYYPEQINNNIPTLNSVGVETKTNYLVINDNYNGSFAKEYQIFDNGNLITTTREKNFDLLNLEVGSHMLYAIAKASGFKNSGRGNGVSYNIYNVNLELNGLGTNLPLKAGELQTINGYLYPTQGYLPKEIVVTVGGNNAEYVYDCYTGEVIISNVTGEVCLQASYCDKPILAQPLLHEEQNIIYWQQIENATYYKVYVDGEFLAESLETSFDLNFKLQEEKNYDITVSAHAENYQDSLESQPLTLAYKNIYPIFGVSGLNDNSSYELTRTDDAVNLNYYYNESSGEIISDFDNSFPYNEMVVVEKEGSKFVKVPEMYFRITTNENEIITDIAVSKKPRETGRWFKSEEFYVACYLSSYENGKMQSLSNKSIDKSHSVVEIRQALLDASSKMQIIDIASKTIIGFLFLIEYANKNSTMFLTRNGNNITTGSTDTITSASGVSVSSKNFKYRHIEDLVGTNLQYIDGLKLKVGEFYTNVYSTNYVKMGWTFSYDNYINGFGWKDEFPFVCAPRSFTVNKEGSYGSKLKGEFANEFIYRFGGLYSATDAGYFLFDTTIEGYNVGSNASRLTYKE